MSHNFSDDHNQFPGPPQKSNNTTIIVVAMAVIGGFLMLICGGIIFGVVMTVREQGQLVDVGFDPDANVDQWDAYSNRPAFELFSESVAAGRYAEAVDDINAGLVNDPDNAFLHNNKAWLLATCPDEDVRDGKVAIEHATKACELTSYRSFAYVDTLAAAYAESGEFESAIEWQEKAIDLSDNAYLSAFYKRLRLFKAKKAYREGVPPQKVDADETTTSTEHATPPEDSGTAVAEPETSDENTTEQDDAQQ